MASCSTLDHAKRIPAGHRSIRKPAGLTASAAKERRLGFVGNSRSFEVGIEIGFGVMMGGHFVEFPALLVQPEPPAFAVAVVVLDSHVDHGGNAGEAVDHDADQGPISKSNDVRRVDAVEQDPGVLGRENRRLALLDDVFGPSDGCGRVERHDLPNDQEIKQRANGGEMLLDGGRSSVSPTVPRRRPPPASGTLRSSGRPRRFAPAKEVPHGPVVRLPRIGIPDTCSEELEKPPRSPIASLGDDRRNQSSQRVGQLLRVVVRYFVCQSPSVSIFAFWPIRSFR